MILSAWSVVYYCPAGKLDTAEQNQALWQPTALLWISLHNRTGIKGCNAVFHISGFWANLTSLPSTRGGAHVFLSLGFTTTHQTSILFNLQNWMLLWKDISKRWLVICWNELQNIQTSTYSVHHSANTFNVVKLSQHKSCLHLQLALSTPSFYPSCSALLRDKYWGTELHCYQILNGRYQSVNKIPDKRCCYRYLCNVNSF